MKKYNYNDWWNGLVALETCPIFLKSGENPTVCQWKDFEITDRKKIKEKQEEIFTNTLNEILEKWKKEFDNRYTKSKIPELLLQEELDYFQSVIFFDIENIPYDSPSFIINRKSGIPILLEPKCFFLTKKYIDDIHIGGKEIVYDFIHSPNFKFKVNQTPPEIFAEILWNYFDWLTEKKEPNEPNENEIKSEILHNSLLKYGFFNLSKVKILTQKNQSKLLEYLCSNQVPYCIAMFDFLDFLSYLEKNHFNKKKDLFKPLAELLESNERTVKGNIYALDEYSNENRIRYSSAKYKEKVINDYEILK